MISDSEMRRLSWIVWVDPKCNSVYPYERRQKEIPLPKRKSPCQVKFLGDHRGREGSNATTSPGMPQPLEGKKAKKWILQ